MKILAFDTAGPALSAAITDDTRTLAALHCPLQRGHAERLLPAVEGLLQAAGLTLGGLDAIATTVGPGSFTGLRTGLAAAQGLALGADKPLVGICRFEALAVASGRLGRAPVVAAMDSKAHSLYVQAFAASDAIADGWPPEGLNRHAEDFGDIVWPEGAMAVGDGAPLLIAAGAPLQDTGRRQLPASVVALCAAGKLRQGNAGLPPHPLYLAPPRAVLPRDGGRLRAR